MNFIEVKLTKHSVFLTEGELSSLLMQNQPLYLKGIERGKSIKRASRFDLSHPKGNIPDNGLSPREGQI